LSNKVIRRIRIKSRRVRWAGHIAGMGEKRTGYGVLVEKPHYEDLNVGGRIILRWILEK
jgi:hypothetical protein